MVWGLWNIMWFWFLLVRCLVQVSGQSCEGSEYSLTENSCYTYHATPLTMKAASAQCQSLGGHLAAITSSARHFLLEKLMADNSVNEVWVGGEQSATLWHWVSDSAILSPQGCWADVENDHDLPHKPTSSFNPITPQSCIKACRDDGYKYAGTQVTDCFCGNTFGRHGTARKCTVRCMGDQKQWCGGFEEAGYSRNFIYNIGGAYGVWAYNQPNDYRKTQRCGCIDNYNKYKFADEACATPFPYFCDIFKKPCSSEYRWVMGRCVFHNNTGTSWHNARQDCISRGGDLLKLDSDDFRLNITSFLVGQKVDEKNWIGLSRGSWVWTTGEFIVYTNWAPNYPMDRQNLCLAVSKSPGGGLYQWLNRNCSEKRPYACQITIPTTTTTIPTTTTTPTTTAAPTTTMKKITVELTTKTVSRRTTVKEVMSSAASASVTKRTPTPSPAVGSTVTTKVPPSQGLSTTRGGFGTLNIILIVVGTIVFSIILVIIIVVFFKRRKLQREEAAYKREYEDPAAKSITTFEKGDIGGLALDNPNMYTAPPVGSQPRGTIGRATNWKMKDDKYIDIEDD